MPNNFSFLHTYCAGATGRSKDGANARQLLLFTHILRPLGALCCWVFGVFILCHTAKNEPRKRAKGYALGSRAAKPRPVRAFGGKLRFPRRRSKVWASADAPSCSAPPPRRVGRGSMPDFGRTRRRHSEKGGVRLKTFLPNGRGTSMNPCRRGIFGFPDAAYATRATSAQP